MDQPPIIDDNVRHEGMGFLRTLNAKTIQKIDRPIVLHVMKPFGGSKSDENQPPEDEPAVVIVPYKQYLELQKVFWPSSLFDLLDKIVVVAEEGRLLAVLDQLQQWTPPAPASSLPKATEPKLPEGFILCAHCGEGFKPRRADGPPLCIRCFGEGHRNGNCMKCAEDAEVKRRASEDSTGGYRDDVDRLAFNDT